MMLQHRAALARQEAHREFAAAFLIGFGFWHATDAVLSHWLFQLHHIRMDTAHPFLWDLGWLGVFGLVPLVLGRRMGGRARTGLPDPRALLPAVLVGATVLAAVVSALPPPGDGARVVLLADGSSPRMVFDALGDSEARIVSGDPAGCAGWTRR
jgi:hypothetical protein